MNPNLDMLSKEGASAKYVFCFSFLVACYSAAMTTFLGAAIAIRSLLAVKSEHADPATLRESAVLPPWEGDFDKRFSTEERDSAALRASASLRESSVLRASQDRMGAISPRGQEQIATPVEDEGDGEELWHEKGTRFRSIIICMLLGDFCICSAGIPIDTVVFTASMCGGCLQPFLMWALLRCSNDVELMQFKPQTWMGNFWMFLSVSICAYLAVDGVIGALGVNDTLANIVAACTTVLSMVYMLQWLNAAKANYDFEGVDNAGLLANDANLEAYM